jgi:peroxiredoxin
LRGIRDQGSEIRDQRSEIRDQRSGIRDQGSEISNEVNNKIQMEMKGSAFLFIIISLLASCTSTPHYIVKCRIEGSDSITFYLQKREAGSTIKIDSAVSRKGSFILKRGYVDHPQLVQLVAGNSRKRTAFYLENSEITITGNLDSLFNAKVTGSKTQDEYDALVESGRQLSDKYTKTSQEQQIARKTKNSLLVQKLEKQGDSIQNEMTRLQKNFIKNNPASYITPSLLAGLSYDMEPDELETMINTLDTAIAALPQIKSIRERLSVMKSVAVGQKAPEFTMNDPEGKPVSLASKIGQRLLLIDFWAAWCNPCRLENPNLVKIYNEFHKKGFDIIGVSLDRNKEDWTKAIAGDKLAWTHVSDLKYRGNEAARLYAVNSIPSNFLLDEKGTIIAKNLQGDDLYEKVKEILEK